MTDIKKNCNKMIGFTDLYTSHKYRFPLKKRTNCIVIYKQVRRAEQQRELTRVKREIIYDKQKELPIRTYEDKSVYQRFKAPNVVRKDNIPNPKDSKNHIKFNDQYFPDQWYLVSGTEHAQSDNGSEVELRTLD